MCSGGLGMSLSIGPTFAYFVFRFKVLLAERCVLESGTDGGFSIFQIFSFLTVCTFWKAYWSNYFFCLKRGY